MVLPVVLGALGGSVLAEGLGARGGPLEAARQGSIRISPGSILKAALDVQALSESGVQPQISEDPFTGNLVVSSVDQAQNLFGILEDREARKLLAPFPEEIVEIRELRDRVIEVGRNLNTSDLRLTQTVANVPVSTRVTGRLIAPGVVGRGNVPAIGSASATASRRLAGPCAGPQTGFSRLRCAQGAFT